MITIFQFELYQIINFKCIVLVRFIDKRMKKSYYLIAYHVLITELGTYIYIISFFISFCSKNYQNYNHYNYKRKNNSLL